MDCGVLVQRILELERERDAAEQRAERLEAALEMPDWLVPFAVGLTCQQGVSDDYHAMTEAFLTWLNHARAALAPALAEEEK